MNEAGIENKLKNGISVAKTKSRLERIDIIKGVGIILVVFGHAVSTDNNMRHFVYLFHMSIFFVASGYCWNVKHSIDILNLKEYFKNKIKSLYIPYITCNGSFLILNNIFLKLNIYTNDSEFINLVGHDYEYSLASRLSIADFFKQLIKVCMLGGGPQLGGALWFVRALFLICIVHGVLEFIIGKYIPKHRKLVLCLIFVICLIVYEFYRKGFLQGIKSFIISCVLGYSAYLSGIFLNNVKINVNYSNLKFLLSFAITFGILLALNQAGSVSIAGGMVTNFFYYIAASIFGWLFLNDFAFLIERSYYVKKGLAYLGRNTMPIVFLHFLAFKLVTFIYILIKKKSILLLAYFPALTGENNYLWFFYTLVGVIIPIILNGLYRTIKNWLLL